MASRVVADSLVAALWQRPVIAVGKRALVPAQRWKYHRPSHPRFNTVTSRDQSAGNPISESMKNSSAPSGDNTATVTPHEARHAAFLGEADSDDGFEAHQETYPEAHRHHFANVDASGLHGQAGEGDEPIERERKPLEPLDAAQSAYLGEADSDDAHESEREIDPAKFSHNINDPSSSGIHGQSGESDLPLEKDHK